MRTYFDIFLLIASLSAPLQEQVLAEFGHSTIQTPTLLFRHRLNLNRSD